MKFLNSKGAEIHSFLVLEINFIINLTFAYIKSSFHSKICSLVNSGKVGLSGQQESSMKLKQQIKN